jgi:signal transduction histidine kinase
MASDIVAPPRRGSLRQRLILLVLAAFTPLVMFSAVLVVLLTREHRELVDRAMRERVRALESALDRELTSAVSTLRALAASSSLARGDLATFYADAEGVLPTQPWWLTIHVARPDGQQLVNLARPYGAPLARISETESLDDVTRTLRPVVGGVARGAVSGYLAFTVRVPVLDRGRLRYVLSAVLSPDAVGELLAEQQLPGDWLGYVLDASLRFVARTRAGDRLVGHGPSEDFRAGIAAGRQRFSATTLEGEQVAAAVTTSPLSGWTIGLAAPEAAVLAPLRLSLLVLLLSGLAAVSIGVGLAIVAARRIARPIAQLADAAAAVGRGEIVAPAPGGVPEIDQVAAALGKASAERRDAEAALHAARDEVVEATRLKDRMIATVSHELRTPLQAILGWLHLVESGKLPQQAHERALRTVRENAQIQARLVEDLLDVSRIMTGTLRLDLAPQRVGDVVERAIDAVRPIAATKEIRLDVQLYARDARVMVDADRLRQVCWNLLTNAVKFTPRKGQVVVSADTVGQTAHIAIADSGQGIAAVDLPRVFDAFWQSDVGPARVHGLGLGLALVREIVELHGGTIEVESPGTGHGSTFRVVLPLMTTGSQAPVSPARLPSAS